MTIKDTISQVLILFVYHLDATNNFTIITSYREGKYAPSFVPSFFVVLTNSGPFVWPSMDADPVLISRHLVYIAVYGSLLSQKL